MVELRIISKIEIRYFRSVYSIDLKNVRDISVLVGENDVGKSNILKSLNLFFNNKTDLKSDFNFQNDLCKLRVEAARPSKVRAHIAIKITFNNYLKWASLLDSFIIKRQWTRYTDQPSDTYPEDVSPSIIGRFLNKIVYHYVPAVRGRDTFRYYLRMLHDFLIEDEKAEIRAASEMLIEQINTSTAEMGSRIKNELGFESSIQVPENLRHLFEALEFSTKSGELDIPLQFRGDGIQTRHIPFILDFITENSNKDHIWGYEEPESSLEMGRAFDLAAQFKDQFSKNSQIFLTTHSPAFYDLSGGDIVAWSVSTKEKTHEGQLETKVERMSDGIGADDALGIAALIKDRAREVYEENKELIALRDNMKEEISRYELPVLLLEGHSDKIIFEHALDKFYENPFVRPLALGGGTKISQYIRAIKDIEDGRQPILFGLFDNDIAGRKDLANIKNGKSLKESFFRFGAGSVYGGLLIVPDSLKDIENFFKNELDADGIEMPLEYIFPGAVIQSAISEGVLIPSETLINQSNGKFKCGTVNLSDIKGEAIGEQNTYFLKKIDDACKKNFAEWVCDQDIGVLENLKPTMEKIRNIIEEAS